MNKRPIIKLYFIAIIPGEPVYSFAQDQKEFFARHYKSRAALRSPPHITLHMPFQYKEEKEDKLIHAFEELSRMHDTFTLDIEDFGAFEPRVIYLDVLKTQELTTLQQAVRQTMKTKLNVFNANYKDQVFNPHLTLAFRDLRKQKFHEAWEEYRNKPYRQSFQVKDFSLLKHTGKEWKRHRSFELKEDHI